MKSLVLSVLLLSTSLYAETVKIDVNGMVCSLCIQGIKKKFGEVEHVSKVDVNLDDKVVTLETHGKNLISDETIKKLVTESGYEVVTITRK